jgi:four helix bundle protein
MKSFEDLEVYQKAFDFTIAIFKLTEKSNINKNIIYQLERASLSISNNIAEGFELQSNKQFVKFLYIAKGSCGECRNLINVALHLHQIESEKHQELKNNAIEISKQLANFIKYLNKSEIY